MPRWSDLADAGMAFLADPAGAVTVGVASLADAGMVTVGVTDLAQHWGGAVGILYKCPVFAGRTSIDTTPVTGSLLSAAPGCRLDNFSAVGFGWIVSDWCVLSASNYSVDFFLDRDGDGDGQPGRWQVWC